MTNDTTSGQSAATTEATSGVRTLIFTVTDVSRGKEILTALLGAGPVMDSPQYVHFTAAGQDVGLVPEGDLEAGRGPVPYWTVPDLDGRIAALEQAGASVLRPAREVGGGRRVAVVADADGNLIGLMQDG